MSLFTEQELALMTMAAAEQDGPEWSLRCRVDLHLMACSQAEDALARIAGLEQIGVRWQEAAHGPSAFWLDGGLSRLNVCIFMPPDVWARLALVDGRAVLAEEVAPC